MNMLRNALMLAMLLALPWIAMPAHGAVVHWRSREVQYSAEGKDIKDVLRDFSASQGVPANIGSDVSGTVSGRFHMAPQKFLDTLASSFGFVWYYDGQVLDITTASAMKSSLVKLNSASTSALRDTLARMGIADPRFPITYDDAQGTAIVNGPPHYVDLVSEVAGRLDNNMARRAGTEIRVFPLSHGWAADRTVDIDGKTITIKGVASLLNSMYHPAPPSPAGHAQSSADGSMTQVQSMPDIAGRTSGGGYGNPPLPPLPTGAGLLSTLTGKSPPTGATTLASSAAPAGAAAGASVNAGGELPVIQADPNTNSVLIRDLPDRMFQYPALIQRLDVKPCLIEIEAHIIEIQNDALRQLGIDWSFHNSHIDLQTGDGTLAQSTYNGTLAQNFGNTTLPGNVSVPATPAGLSLAAVLGDSGRYLLSRISALEGTNAAKIDASPKVTTLDNVEAVMDQKTRFFVRVSGYTSADLYQISTGVSLRVRPMVVTEHGRTQIKLDVKIEDGNLTGQTVDNIPIITSTHINTEAFITQGQALLIAGYQVDNNSNGVNGVPGLSKIPVLGALFRQNDDKNSHFERLFLLTPKIISDL